MADVAAVASSFRYRFDCPPPTKHMPAFGECPLAGPIPPCRGDFSM